VRIVVSIAFRRLVQSSPDRWEQMTGLQVCVSIAFRRLVQSSHPAIIAGFPGGPVGLHCLSAFGSVVTSLGGGESRRPAGGVSIAFRRLVQSSLHYGKVNHWTTGLESPLPFGVWFSRHLRTAGSN